MHCCLCMLTAKRDQCVNSKKNNNKNPKKTTVCSKWLTSERVSTPVSQISALKADSIARNSAGFFPVPCARVHSACQARVRMPTTLSICAKHIAYKLAAASPCKSAAPAAQLRSATLTVEFANMMLSQLKSLELLVEHQYCSTLSCSASSYRSSSCSGRCCPMSSRGFTNA
jgi:hypothetical protein